MDLRVLNMNNINIIDSWLLQYPCSLLSMLVL